MRGEGEGIERGTFKAASSKVGLPVNLERTHIWKGEKGREGMIKKKRIRIKEKKRKEGRKERKRKKKKPLKEKNQRQQDNW